MVRRLRAFGFVLVALIGTTQVFPVLSAHAEGELPDVEEIEIGGGGTISISVFGDLGACASVSFNDVQVKAASTLSAMGAGTSWDGSARQISGADNEGGSNVSSLDDVCVPGDSTLNAAEVTFQANAAGFNADGIVTTMSATTSCVYWHIGGLTCSRQATVVVPPSVPQS